MLKSKRGPWERVAHMVAHRSLGFDGQVDTIWPVRQLGVFVCIFEVVRFFFSFFFLHLGGLKWLLEKQHIDFDARLTIVFSKAFLKDHHLLQRSQC